MLPVGVVGVGGAGGAGGSPVQGVTHDTCTLDTLEVEITKILLKNPVDLRALRRISRSKGGFGCNKLRARVWPKLLGINRYTVGDYRSYIDPHKDDEQVGEREGLIGIWHRKGVYMA
jgi:hypothetical protein